MKLATSDLPKLQWSILAIVLMMAVGAALIFFAFSATEVAKRDRAIAQAILDRDAAAAQTAAHEHLAYIRHASREIHESEAQLGQSLRRLSGGGLGQRTAPTPHLATDPRP